jgi:hypothetical protein
MVAEAGFKGAALGRWLKKAGDFTKTLPPK